VRGFAGSPANQLIDAHQQPKSPASAGLFHWRTHMPRGIPRKSLIGSHEVEAVNRAAAAPEFRDEEFHTDDIQVVEPNRLEAKAKEEKFMNELVEIQIEPGDKPNDPLYVQIGHNGINQMVLRGQPQTVKRRYLYSALMAKTVAFACDFRRGPNDTEINRLSPSVSGAFRAHLLRDDNPLGGTRWVKRVMSEASGIRA